MPPDDMKQMLQFGDIEHLTASNGDRLEVWHGIDHDLKQSDVEVWDLVKNDCPEAAWDFCDGATC